MNFKEGITTFSGLLICVLSALLFPYFPLLSTPFFLFGASLFLFSFHKLENAFDWVVKKFRI